MNAILVTGATGNVGRPLVTLLANAGANVRAVTRRPGSAGFPAGVGPSPVSTVPLRYSSTPVRSAMNSIRS